MTNTICLCLDVDQTIMNSEYCDDLGNAFDINGEDQKINMHLYDLKTHKPTLWYSSLFELKKMCAAKGVNLEIHIISAKMSGNIDDTIDAVVKILYPLLLPNVINGTMIYHQMPNRYIYQTYLVTESKVKYANNSLCNGYDPLFVEGDYHNQNILTNIHIPYGNDPVGATSKAAVMQRIEMQLRLQGKQPVAMILVDDYPGYGPAVSNSNKIGNCRYSFISACELEHRQHAPMIHRIEATLDLLAAIQSEIAQYLPTSSSSSGSGYYDDKSSSGDEAGLF